MHVPEDAGMCSSFPPSSSLILPATASSTFLELIKYLYMYYTQCVLFLGPVNKPGYVILMGTPMQYSTLNYQLPAGSTIGFTTSLTHSNIYL